MSIRVEGQTDRRGCLSHKSWLRQRKDKIRRAGSDEGVLLAIDRIGHRIRPQRRAQINFPERLAGYGVEREEIAFVASGKNETTRGRERADPRMPKPFISVPGMPLRMMLPTSASPRRYGAA